LQDVTSGAPAHSGEGLPVGGPRRRKAPPGLAGRTAGALLSAALILGLFVVAGDIGRLADVLDGHGLPLVLSAVALYVGNGMLKAARWAMLLRAAGVRTPFLRAYPAFLAGMAVNNLLPTGLAGEPVRLARLDGGISPAGIAATTADRALDATLLTVATVAGIPLLAGLDPDAVPMVAAGAALCALAVGLAAAWIWRRGRLAALVRRPAAGVGALLLTVAIQANDPLRLVLLASGYGVDLGFWRSVAIVAMATIVGAVTIIGGGAGVAVTVGALAAAAGAPAESAAALGLVFVATSTWLSFPLGALAALVGRRTPRPTEARWT
jgi:uncharacterized membrane protein YbhN (UPF0104 family)